MPFDSLNQIVHTCLYFDLQSLSKLENESSLYNPEGIRFIIQSSNTNDLFIPSKVINITYNFYTNYNIPVQLKGYSAEAAPLDPELKLSINLTVLASKGTVVPPD